MCGQYAYACYFADLGHLRELLCLVYDQGDDGCHNGHHDDYKQEWYATACATDEVGIRDQWFLCGVLSVAGRNGGIEEVRPHQEVHESEPIEEVVHALRMQPSELEQVYNLYEIEHV